MSKQTQPPLRALTVAGIMSGTSADGIDVAIVQIKPAGTRKRSAAVAEPLTFDLLAHRSFPFPAPLRNAVLAAQDAKRTSTAELAHLHWRLGLAYAEAVQATLRKHTALTLDLVGCHGQTIYHQATRASKLGRSFACTWQIGEPALIANALGIPVVSNFRPADMVVGGQGAPLVSLLDTTLYRDAKHLRVLQNIGGIGNLTAVPPLGSSAAARAFDTGPGNMVIDRLTTQLFGKPFDRGGRIAADGHTLLPVLREFLRAPFFAKKPPKTAGREEFGDAYAAAFLAACRKHSLEKADAVATATALTAHSIANAVARFVLPDFQGTDAEIIVSGGGAKNATLLAMLRDLLAPHKASVLNIDDPALPSSMPVEAKEAVAFALLAYMTWHQRPGNVPSATGAKQSAVLGQVTYA